MKEINRKQKTKSNESCKAIIQNPQDVAKKFNKFFTSVGPKLAKKMPNFEETL